MKKYLIHKQIEAERMTLAEAECRADKKLSNQPGSTIGYLVCDSKTRKCSWVNDKDFEAMPFESVQDMSLHFYRELGEWYEQFKIHGQNKRGLSVKNRRDVVNITMHVKFLKKTLGKFINLDTLNSTSL